MKRWRWYEIMGDKSDELEGLRDELRILREENLVLREQVRYWKWQAVSWGAPDYENFEFERTK